jgi:hypothetical protein
MKIIAIIPDDMVSTPAKLEEMGYTIVAKREHFRRFCYVAVKEINFTPKNGKRRLPIFYFKKFLASFSASF